MPEFLLCCALGCSHSRLFCAPQCCLLLLQLCLLFNHLRSSAFSPFSTAFCHFCIFHTSLSPIFHTSLSPFSLHKLMRFVILSFISLTWWSLMGEMSLILLSIVLPSVALYIIIRQYFWSFINAGTYSQLGTSVHPFSVFLRASVLPPAGNTWPSLQPPAFSPFSTSFCHLCIF